EISYVYGKSKYMIEVKNPHNLNRGLTTVELDGSVLEGSELELIDDGKTHQVIITIENKSLELKNEILHEI
ncbi:MAG: hypothetical protein H7235_03960, partial [Bdellovibrionaceae bacterium]|nr:hypothetical protein [Pseudobdellovibrionaceae bacterium]